MYTLGQRWVSNNVKYEHKLLRNEKIAKEKKKDKLEQKRKGTEKYMKININSNHESKQ